MESKTIIQLQSLEPYRHLFPEARAIDNTVKMGATVSDTVEFIPMVIKKTQWQVEQFVNQELRGLPTYEACKKLWHFVKNHIRYKKDERGIEQVRSARRLIHDAVGDCDCFTTFIGTCLSVLNIPIINRITKYKQSFFQHIYPIVPLGNGKYIIMDCVVDEFNYEEPYTEKKDYKMDLHYLDGIEDDKLNGNVDARDLFGWDNDMGELGKLFKRRQNTSAMPQGNQGGQGKKKGFQKFKTFAKKALNVVNKANPATALLRAGILASMKLNIMKVPQKLKWAYLSEDEARKKGADMSKFGKLKNILYKIEQIFFTAGGKPENLKKAILTGRGNRNKEVNGLGFVDEYDNEMLGIDENSSLSSVLGASVYQDEFVNGLEGTEGLGSAVATGASITAATTVMAAIAGLLKGVGNLFPNKKNNADFKEEGKGGGDGGNTSDSSESGGGDEIPTVKTSSGGGNNNTENSNSSSDNSESNNTSSASSNNVMQKSESSNDDGENNNSSGSANKGVAKTETEGEPKKGFKEFWEKNKKWMKPLGIGLGAATVLYIGYRAIKGNSTSTGSANKSKTTAALNGIGKRRKRTKGKHKGQHGKKSNVALM